MFYKVFKRFFEVFHFSTKCKKSIHTIYRNTLTFNLSMAGLIYRKTKMVLNFREDKPEVYKAQQVVLPQVSTDELYDEISQSCGVNTAQTQAVINALENRLVHYIKLGHPVRIGVLGSLNPRFRSKTTKKLEDADASTVTRKVIQFIPGSALDDTIKKSGVNFYKTLSEQED